MFAMITRDYTRWAHSKKRSPIAWFKYTLAPIQPHDKWSFIEV